ncbi:Uncharacterised protein [Enterobacter cloacae]|uniref:Integrase n=3 Tax=Enterobacter cloacae complex TaxID=354276 RepID=A0ABD7L498_9ENTR|nr:hypothetical protein ECL_B122 [Enterobacter cloacae subsp. cloacae ATCC 13047]AWG43854.1 hypothetical protein BFJ73_21590 [Enterobacter cloacae]SAF46365.1 Uncharacterised protein [Enterobacter hormaechei]BBV33498.1 hypothetical protein STW0522CIT01_P20900 [Citrobacter freundii]GDB25479.1 hypothetical protein HmCmsJML259_00356 [Escherichia coli]
MSQSDYSRIAEQLKSGKQTKLPAMKVSDLKEILWWLDFLQGRPL